LKKRYPSFPLYPKDFISSLDVQAMTIEEIGGYCLLLFNSWIQKRQCYLPDDDEDLRILCKMNEEQWEKHRDKILKKFKKNGKFIFNKRLRFELKIKREFSKKKSESGKQGGRPSETNTYRKSENKAK